MSDQSRLVSLLEGLARAGDGKFHRDDAIRTLTDETEMDEAAAAEWLESVLAFDDRGFTYVQAESPLDVESFGGDVGGLRKPPGRVTGEQFHGLSVLERPDGGHPLIPTTEEYFERTLPHGDATDVAVLCRTMADPAFNPLLIGEAGTGKDTLIRHVCAETNRPMVRVNFGSDVRYEDLVGMYTLDEDGGMSWEDGYLTKAVRYGWVFVADELNAAPPESTMPLHQVTEERRKSSLVLRSRSETVDPHPQFRFVGTMNPVGGGYGGTNQLNDAFKSRFYAVQIDYLDEEREVTLLAEQLGEDTPLDEAALRRLCALAAELRDRHRASDLRTPVTTRELLKIGRLAETMTLTDAARTVLLGHVSESDEQLIEDAIDAVL
ncbi:MAG: AAA family ATPase [Halobaculum sp.]